MDWSKLNHLQLGKYGEYLAKMEFIKHGFDVYSAEVDDKGIDFIVRNSSKKFFEIQVKSIRNKSYVFMRKEVFAPKENLYLALLIFGTDEQPTFVLIPSVDWKKKTHAFLTDKDYKGKKSKPEYGISISARSIAAIKLAYPSLMFVENSVVHHLVEDI